MKTENVVTLIIDGKNKSVTAIKDAMGNLTQLDNAANKTKTNLGSMFSSVSGIAAAAGIGLTGAALFSFGKDAVVASAQLGVLRENFKGSRTDIELFNKATAGTVTEANLLKLSNQATDLGLTMQQQAILFSLAEDAADKYGGGVEENFQRVLKASEGATKGLKELGIQKAVYDDIVKGYLEGYGVKNLEQLDAETQKWIQVESVIKAAGVTLQDVANKAPDAADKIEGIGVKWETFKTETGDVLLPVLGAVLDSLNWIFDAADEAGNEIDRLLGLKGLMGNGAFPTSKKIEGLSFQDSIQNQADLAFALSHNTYVKNGKLISEEITRINKLATTTGEINAKNQKYQNAEAKFLGWKKSLYDDLLGNVDKQTLEFSKQSSLFVDMQGQLKGYPILQQQSSELFDQWIEKTDAMSTTNVPHLLYEMEKLSHEFGVIPGYLELSQRFLKAMKDPIKAATATFKQAGFDVPIGVDFSGVNKNVNKNNSFGLPKELTPIDTTAIEASIELIKSRINEIPTEAMIHFLLMEGTVEKTFGFMAQAAESWYQIAGEKQSVYFELCKAFAIAETSVNTYNSAVAAYKAMVGIPIIGPGLAVAAAASAVAYGYGNIRRIASTHPGGNGGGGVSTPSASLGGVGLGSGLQSMMNSNNTTNNNTTNQPIIHLNVSNFSGKPEDADKFARELAKAIQKLFKDGLITTGGNG